MLSQIWNTALVVPLLNLTVFLYHLVGDNLGIAIIILTLLVRGILLPIMIPSMRNLKKQKDLQPEIDKIKKKYSDNRQKQAEAQMALFKEHGLNPAAGCLSQLPILLVLVALYGVIRKIASIENAFELNSSLYFDSLKFSVERINTEFFYMNLGSPEGFPYIFVLLAGLFQFFSSKYSFGFTKKGEALAERTPDKKDDLAYNIQEQMLYMMPITTVIIGLSLPSGVVLYLATTSLFSLLQSYFIFGNNKVINAEDVKNDKKMKRSK